jgi:hypothetical protein
MCSGRRMVSAGLCVYGVCADTVNTVKVVIIVTMYAGNSA